MAQDSYPRVSILYPGDHEARRNATSENNRFAELFRAFAAKGIGVEPAVYHDEFCEEVREQLMRVDGVLVWSNPIEGGRDRSVLDSMLRVRHAQRGRNEEEITLDVFCKRCEPYFGGIYAGIFQSSGIAIFYSDRREWMGRTRTSFAKSTSAVLRRIPTLPSRTLSMRPCFGYKRRNRNAA